MRRVIVGKTFYFSIIQYLFYQFGFVRGNDVLFFQLRKVDGSEEGLLADVARGAPGNA